MLYFLSTTGDGTASGGSGMGGIASMLDLCSGDPNKMNDNDAARVMNDARKERPDAIQQTVKEKPWFVKVLGNPKVMSALTMSAAKLFSNRRN